jgi:hypothetical protein
MSMCLPKIHSGRPEEDVGVIIGSGKQGINIGGFVRHEEWEQSFDELEHSRGALDARTDLGHARGEAVLSYHPQVQHLLYLLWPFPCSSLQ